MIETKLFPSAPMVFTLILLLLKCSQIQIQVKESWLRTHPEAFGPNVMKEEPLGDDLQHPLLPVARRRVRP